MIRSTKLKKKKGRDRILGSNLFWTGVSINAARVRLDTEREGGSQSMEGSKPTILIADEKRKLAVGSEILFYIIHVARRRTRVSFN